MKPSFALNLSHDGLCLLRRTGNGWQAIGEVALDDPELGESLAMLRRTAAEMAGGQMASKLVIPNSEILYRTLECDATDDAGRQREIADRLDGLTPYSLDEIVFDWRPAGESGVHVAAVARETLAEAEAFATEHRFNPVCFVAIPQAGDFPGEPFFGVTRLAAELVGPDDEIERDSQAIVVVQSCDTPLAESPESPAADPAPDREPDAAETAGDAPQEAAGSVGETAVQTAADEGEDAPRDATEDAPDTADGGTRDDAPEFSSRRDAQGGADAPPTLNRLKPRFLLLEPESIPAPESLPDSAPRAAIEQADAPEARQGPDVAAQVAPDVVAPAASPARALAQEITRMPVTSAEIAGSERRRGPKGAASRPGRMPPPLQAPTPDRPARPDAGTATPWPRRAEEERSLAIFGTRDQSAGVSGRLARSFPLLLAALVTVVVIAGAIIWSRNDGATSTALPDPAAEVELSALPPGDGSLGGATGGDAISGTPQEIAPPEEIAAIAPDRAPDVASGAPSARAPDEAPGQAPNEAPDPAEGSAVPTAPDVSDLAAAEAGPGVLTEDAAAEIHARSGIWPLAPAPLGDLQADRLADLYVASIDRQVIGHDAIALQTPALDRDLRPLGQFQPPPPAGTRFDLDDRGFVRATPEGSETPSGAVVFAGRPATVPDPRPGSAPQQPLAQPDRQLLAAVRPLARPKGLVETDERARLGGRSRSELARIRPVARPPSPQSPGLDVDLTPTKLAVLKSRTPELRPNGIAAAVERALAEARANPAAGNSAVAAVAPARVPQIPTKASVAREATVEHAISLSRVNLIGVYGKSSDRRALVRLKNGRFVKVKVGDRLDGGKVAEISGNKLKYIKRGRTVTLEIPS